jgi:hypothetical protein
MPGGIKHGRIFGNTGQSTSLSWGILLGDSSSSPAKYAVNQTFYDLDVQNFYDDFVVGSDAYSDTWVGGVIALSAEGGLHFKAFSGLTNEGENFSFHGTNFGNNQLHDVLVDAGALAEVNASGTSFDYAGGAPGVSGCSTSTTGSDSISSSGTLFLNADSSHFERCPGAKFINCSNECSVAVSDSEMFLVGSVASTDAFGEFAPIPAPPLPRSKGSTLKTSMRAAVPCNCSFGAIATVHLSSPGSAMSFQRRSGVWHFSPGVRRKVTLTRE